MPIWRNTIKIKSLLNDNTSNQKVLEICNSLIWQLEHVLNFETTKVKKNTLDKDWLEDHFEPIIDDFKFVKSAIEQNLDAEDYSFESWCDAFNEYMNKLYDIGDVVTVKRGFSDSQKFLFVG